MTATLFRSRQKFGTGKLDAVEDGCMFHGDSPFAKNKARRVRSTYMCKKCKGCHLFPIDLSRC